MEIEYFGHSCFLITTKSFSICLDPFADIGLKEPKVNSDYYFCSHEHYDHNNYKICNAKPLDGNVSYKIISTYHDDKKGALRGKNNVIVINNEGFSLAHLGDLGEVDNQLIEELLGVDVLLCPIGGKYTINYLEAIKLINEIKPKVVIPMHYKIKGSTIDVDGLENFLNNVNFSIKYMPNKIIINKGELLAQTQVFVLEAKGE